MMFKILKFYIIFLIFGILVLPLSFSEEVYTININNPYYKKAPIAVPELMSVSGSRTEAELASRISRDLSKILLFTDFFRIISPDAFLEEPKEKGIKKSRIDFRNWTITGAELLVTGSVIEDSGNIVVELLLFDTLRERELVRREYPPTVNSDTSIRKIVTGFGAEIVKKFTGNIGLFKSKIAFISTGTGNKEIYICDFDGFRPRRVTDSKSINLSPAWSSNGKYLAYTSYIGGKPDIYIKNLRDGSTTLTVDKKGSNITPAWIPGKDMFAASLSYEGNQGIYLLTRKGKIRKRLTGRWSKWGIDVSPSFSPDGKKMVFISKRSGTPQLYIQELSSGRIKRLTYQGNYNTSPSWAPAGDRIAWAGSVDGRFEIFVVGTDGRNPVQLTSGSGDNEAPSWSPDGTMLAFASTREGMSRIYVMNAFGKNQRRLLSLPGMQTNPKWSANIFR